MEFFHAYSEFVREQVTCLDESLADQSQAIDCDINVLVKRFGVVPPSAYVPRQAIEDFVTPMDYQTAVATLDQASESFETLPSEVRERFKNDPFELLSFVADDKNRDEAMKLGLVAAPPSPPEPMLVKVVTEPPKG